MPAAGSVDYAASLVCHAAGNCQILGGAAASVVVLLPPPLWHGDVHLIATVADVAAAVDELLPDGVVALQMPEEKFISIEDRKVFKYLIKQIQAIRKPKFQSE